MALNPLGARCTVGYIGRDEAEETATALQQLLRSPPSPRPVRPDHHEVARDGAAPATCRLDRESPPPPIASPPTRRNRPRKGNSRLVRYAKGLLTDELVARVTARARRAFVALMQAEAPTRPRPDLITPNKRESLILAGIDLPPHTPYPAEVCARLH